MRHRSFVFALLVCSATLGQGPSARAQGVDPTRLAVATEAFDEGTRLFKAKNYEAAAAQFETAERFAPSAASLANAIRARRAAHHLARAATHSAQALARYPSHQAIVDLARQVLAVADRELYRAEVACVPDCTLVVDEKVAAVDPVSNYVLYLDPGPHTVVASWGSKRRKTQTVTAVRAGLHALAFEAPPEVAVPPVPPPVVERGTVPSPPPDAVPSQPAPSGLPPWVFFASVGATAALAGVTVWSGLDTQQSPGADAVTKACAAGLASCDQLYEDGRSRQLRTNILIGASAGVATVTALVGIFWTNWKGSTSSITPTVGLGHQTTVGVLGHF